MYLDLRIPEYMSEITYRLQAGDATDVIPRLAITTTALASILYRLGIMETYGTGIPRMIGLYRNQPVRPRIETTTNSFKVILPITVQEELSGDELRVMELFAERDSIRRTDVESSLGISKTKASGILSSLEDLGLIVRNGSGRDVSCSRKFDFRCNMRSRTNTNEYERIRTHEMGPPTRASGVAPVVRRA